MRVRCQRALGQDEVKGRDPLTGLWFSVQEKLVLPVQPKKPFPTGLCCLLFGLVVFLSGLVLTSVYVYRHHFIPKVSRPVTPAQEAAEELDHVTRQQN